MGKIGDFRRKWPISRKRCEIGRYGDYGTLIGRKTGSRGAGFNFIIFDDLSDPNPGFKVTGLKVEYLADGARVFSCIKHSCRSLGALPKTCKKIGGRR